MESSTSVNALCLDVQYELYAFLDTETLANLYQTDKQHKTNIQKYSDFALKKYYPFIAETESIINYHSPFALLLLARGIEKKKPNISLLNQVIKQIYKHHGFDKYIPGEVTEEIYSAEKLYMCINHRQEILIKFIADKKGIDVFDCRYVENATIDEKYRHITVGKKIMGMFCSEILPMFVNVRNITINENAGHIISSMPIALCERIEILRLEDFSDDIDISDLVKFANAKELIIIPGNTSCFAVTLDLLKLNKLQIFGFSGSVLFDPELYKHKSLEKIRHYYSGSWDIPKSRTHMFKIKEYKVAGTRLEMIIDK